MKISLASGFTISFVSSSPSPSRRQVVRQVFGQTLPDTAWRGLRFEAVSSQSWDAVEAV